MVENFKQKADLEMYSQLPDYDDFQGYDLGIETILSQIAQKIYANFHKPSWQTLSHHLCMAKIPKMLFRDRKNIDGDEKGRYQT